jgi:hypothetical protein
MKKSGTKETTAPPRSPIVTTGRIGESGAGVSPKPPSCVTGTAGTRLRFF